MFYSILPYNYKVLIKWRIKFIYDKCESITLDIRIGWFSMLKPGSEEENEYISYLLKKYGKKEPNKRSS